MAGKKVAPNATLLVLREIRDEVRKTNARLDGVNERRERVERHVPEMEIRLASAITDMVGVMGQLRESFVEMRSELREVRDLLREEDRKRLNDHEQRLAALERKAG